MSRLAKKPIMIPASVNVTIDGQMIMAKGPKGQLAYRMHDTMMAKQQDNTLVVTFQGGSNEALPTALQEYDRRFLGAIIGTTCANVKNIITGVADGYERKLLLVGVGFRGQVQGKQLNLSLGYSHPVVFDIPEGISIEMPIPTEIVIKGIDRQLVGQIAANIRSKRPVEPYKGKGVRYDDEVVRLKEVKKK